MVFRTVIGLIEILNYLCSAQARSQEKVGGGLCPNPYPYPPSPLATLPYPFPLSSLPSLPFPPLPSPPFPALDAPIPGRVRRGLPLGGGPGV